MEEGTHITRRGVLAAAGAAGAVAVAGKALASGQPQPGQRPGGARAPGARPKGAVRIAVPASVAFDIKKMKAGIAALAERLGCGKCFSGADCLFQLERDLVINDRLELGPAARVSAPEPDGDPAHSVTVNLAREVRFNINQVQAAVEEIADKLGHAGCFSGFDVAFRDELRVLAVNKNLDVQAVGF